MPMITLTNQTNEQIEMSIGTIYVGSYLTTDSSSLTMQDMIMIVSGLVRSEPDGYGYYQSGEEPVRYAGQGLSKCGYTMEVSLAYNGGLEFRGGVGWPWLC